MTDRTSEDVGPERRCARCEEFWPMDLEFFYWRASGRARRRGRWDRCCRACRLEQRIEKRAAA